MRIDIKPIELNRLIQLHWLESSITIFRATEQPTGEPVKKKLAQQHEHLDTEERNVYWPVIRNL